MEKDDNDVCNPHEKDTVKLYLILHVKELFLD